EGGFDRHLLAVTQVAVVDLVAVGGDHRGVPGVVEDLRHPAERVVLLALGAEAAHRPYLRHRGRGHETAVTGGDRRGLVGVDRIVVADRLEPVADHRHVHRITAGSRRGRAVAADPLGRLQDLLGGLPPNISCHRILLPHRGTRGMPRPAVAISSRITSLTPPPKVMTTLRLAIMSSQRSSSAVSSSAGSPKAPTISSARRPTRWIRSVANTLVAEASAMSTASLLLA